MFVTCRIVQQRKKIDLEKYVVDINQEYLMQQTEHTVYLAASHE